MNFALLGGDPAVLPLVNAIADHPDHNLIYAVSVESIQSQLVETSPKIFVLPDGEQLLHDDEVDAVILAGSEDVLLAQVKRFAADNRSVIVFPHYQQGASFIYELALIRDDVHVALFPAFMFRYEPEVCRLSELLCSEKLGRVLEIQLDRELKGIMQSENSRMLSSTQIDESLLSDIDLLRFLGGEYQQVTALRTGNSSEGFTRTTVSLAGDKAAEAVWSMTVTSGNPSWCLTVNTVNGKVTLSQDSDQFALKFDGDFSSEIRISPSQAGTDRLDPAQRLLKSFEVSLAGESDSLQWRDAIRAYDIVEASHRSLKRRRTIDLYLETTSEQTIFKSQMTAIGCGVLTVTFLGLLLYLLVGSLFEIHPTVLKIARVLWLLPLVIFLAMQFLLTIANPSVEKRDREES